MLCFGGRAAREGWYNAVALAYFDFQVNIERTEQGWGVRVLDEYLRRHHE